MVIVVIVTQTMGTVGFNVISCGWRERFSNELIELPLLGSPLLFLPPLVGEK